MTIPDQAMTVTELFRRFASGQELGGRMFAGSDEFDEDGNPIQEVVPDLATMDYADQEEYIRSRRADLEKRKQEAVEKVNKRKKQAKDEQRKREVALAVQTELRKAKAQGKAEPGDQSSIVSG